MKKNMMTILAMILAATVLMSACTAPAENPANANGAVGTILLSVNPEIEISYDRNGLVIELEGINDDGKTILASYEDFQGKSCETVVAELVNLIYQSGTVELEMDGKPKNIVVKLEEGSAYPNEAFLNSVAQSIRTAVADQGGQSDTMIVDRTDLDQNGLIGLEKAKELVLAQLNFTEADFTNKEYELDDGRYELEFTVDGIEYEYEVDAYTGKILKAQAEKDDDVAPPASNTGSATNAAITLEEAKALVFAHLGVTEDQMTRKEFKLDDGKYEIDFTIGTTEYDVDVDPATGKILKIEKEIDDDAAPPASNTGSATNAAITLEEAKALVFAHLGVTEDQMTRKEFKLDDGKYEISFHIGNMEYEAEVDPATGNILKIEKEIDDD